MTITSRGSRDVAGITRFSQAQLFDSTSKMTQKENMTFSSLTSEERGILALMKSIDYGRLEHLAIRDGRIVRTNDSRKIQFTKLGAKSVQRKTGDDFILSEKHIEFLELVRGTRNGIINTIQIQAGLPVSVETEEPIAII